MSAAAPKLGGSTYAGELLPLLRRGGRAPASGVGRYANALFVAATAALFVRPAEIMPELEGWPIYAVLVTCALALALPIVLAQLAPAALLERPITACVVGMLVAIVLSHLSTGSMWSARMAGAEFCKLLFYYLLLVAAVDSLTRLRRFLSCIVVLGAVVTGLALLQYHGYIDLPALAAIEQGATDAETGEHVIVTRLVSTGIFNDPNDLCLLLVLTMAACIHGFEDRRLGRWRFCWLAPLAIFAYGLTLTHSRGGFVALLVATVVFLWARLGWRRGVAIAVVALPVMFYAFAGRQTELSVEEGTAQERVRIWSDGLTLFRNAPIFGIGYGMLAEQTGRVAHNSFLQCFVELGFVGGTLFLGAFALALRTLHKLRNVENLGEELRFRPYLMAIVGGYAAGMLSLSRVYVVPTYLVLGLTAAYAQIARGRAPIELPRVGLRLGVQLGALAVGFLGCTYVFVRVFVRWE